MTSGSNASSSSSTSDSLVRAGSRRVVGLVHTAALSLLILLLASHVVLEASAAPSASAVADYDTVRELYELLMRRASLEDAAARRGAGDTLQLLQDSGALMDHELVRKSTANRSPSLRLRFGRRADPLLAPSFRASSATETVNN